MIEKKKAVISMWSQSSIDKENVIEVVTPGLFYKEEDCYLAVYDETEISGMEGTRTTFKIYPERFSLIREGTTTTEMKFKENNEDYVLYSTPQGILEMKINTKSIKIDMNDKGGEVNIKYKMSIEGIRPNLTELKIKIKV